MRHSYIGMYVLGFISLGCSVFLLMEHAFSIKTMQEDALPLLGSVVELEERGAFLKEQLEVAQLHTAIQNGSEEERINVFVLPEVLDLDRSISVFDLIGDALRSKEIIRDFSGLEVGDARQNSHGGAMHPVSFSLSANAQGRTMIMALVRIAGLLTVGDAIGPQDRDLLIERTEAENPAGITALEQFFATDLLQYVRDPRAYEDALLRSFSSTGFLDAFHAVRDDGLLQEARELLGGPLADTVQTQRLWPLPFMQLESVRAQPEESDWQKLDMTVLIYSRT